MKWRFLIIASMSLILGALLGLHLALNHAPIVSRTKNLLELHSTIASGYIIKIESLEASILPPSIELTGIEVKSRQDASLSLSLSHANITMQPWPSLRGNLVLTRTVLDRLSGHVDLDELTKETPRSASQRELLVEFRAIDLYNLSLELTHQTKHVSIKDTSIHVTTDSSTKRELFVELPKGRLVQAEHNTEFELSGRFVLNGPLTKPQSVFLNKVHLKLPHLQLTSHGDIEISKDSNLQLSVEGTANLEGLSKRHLQYPLLGGKCHFQAQILGALNNPKATLKLHNPQFSMMQQALGKLELNAHLTPKQIDITEFNLSHPDIGHVGGDAKLALDQSLTLQLNTTLRQLAIERILDRVGLPNPWIKLKLGGSLNASGSLRPLNLNAHIDSDVTSFQSLNGPYNDATSKSMLTLNNARVVGPAQITSQQISIDKFKLMRDQSSISLTGWLSTTGTEGMELRFADAPMNLKDLSPIASLPISGNGTVSGTIEGPYDNLTISSTTAIRNLSVLGYGIGNTRATIVYHNQVLQIARILANSGGGQLRGTGDINFKPRQMQTSGKLTLHGVGVDSLLTTLKQNPVLASKLSGPIDGQITFSGALLHPRAHGVMTSPKLAVDDIDLGSISVVLRSDGDQRKLWLRGELLPTHGHVRFKLGFQENNNTIKVGAKNIPLKAITPFIGDVELQGNITGKLSMHGPFARLTGLAETTIKKFNAYGLQLGTTDIRASARKGQAHITGTLDEHEAKLTANLLLGAKAFPYTATIEFRDIKTGKLGELRPAMSMSLSGSVFSQGDLRKPNTMTSHAVLNHATLHIGNSVFEEARPLRLSYANSVFNLSDIALRDPYLSVQLSGRIPKKQAMNLTLQVNGSLEGLPEIWPQIQTSRGHVKAKARIMGSQNAPSWMGSGKVHNGQLKIASLENPIENIEASLRLRGQTMRLLSAKANLGGGTISFSGDLSLSNQPSAPINMKAELHHVDLHPIDDLDITLSGKLELIGPQSKPLLQGDLDLESARYSSNIDATRFLQRRAAPLEIPAIEADRAWKLHLNVKGDNNLFLANNIVEGEFQTSIRLSGTTARMGAIGTVSRLSAQANYAGNTYNIERANIDFTDEYRLFPRFDIRGTTQACGISLALEIQGTLEEYNIDARGHDDSGPVSSRDAILCAQFGMRLDTLAASSSENNPLRNTLPGAVDAIWKVTGMDEKVKRLLPVVDEFRLTSGYSRATHQTEPRILVTKELGKGWELKYNGPVNTADDYQHVLALEYQLATSMTLESTWVSVSEVSIGDLGLDLRLHWEFE